MNKSLARQYLAETRDIVLKIFGSRCIRCGKFTQTIHEIIPISHGKKYLAVRNRVPCCLSCHSWAHEVGTNVSIPILLEERKKFLVRKWGMRKHGTAELQRNL